MEVLDPTEWSAEIVCGECGAWLRIVATDLYRGQPAMGWDDWFLVTCGACNEPTTPRVRFPRAVRDAVPQKTYEITRGERP